MNPINSLIRDIKALLYFFTLLIFISGDVVYATWYQSDIEYQQSLTRLFGQESVNWEPGISADSKFLFNSVRVSTDASKIVFSVKCEFCSTTEVRPFIVNSNGSGLEDISSIFPADISNKWSGWGNLLINDDASKVFIYASTSGWQIFSHNILSGTSEQALLGSFYHNDWDERVFTINEDGSRFYFGTYYAGWDADLQDRVDGLFFGDYGAEKTWFLDVDDMPCVTGCGNNNFMTYYGSSATTDQVFLLWKSDYFTINNSQALYLTGLDGTPVRITDEKYFIDEGNPTLGISNTDGSKVFYISRDLFGDPQRLNLIDLTLITEQEITWTSDLNGMDAFMSRSGDYIFVKGGYGDEGWHYHTLFNLQTGAKRDTWSYYLPGVVQYSNMTLDDNSYYVTLSDSFYRIDMNSGLYSQAPAVTDIQFNAPALLHQDGHQITIKVSVSDAQGLSNIEQVRLIVLVEGMEMPAWTMGREPLAFPSGDPGSVLLYDDATHGDTIAGDGIYSFDAIATRKGEDDYFNTWYSHFTLPHEVGIRILAKDLDGNYGIADSKLMITNNSSDILGPADKLIGAIYLLLF